MRAIWKDTVIAESDDTVVVEGNHYFPADAISEGVLQGSNHTSVCPWKGTANYHHVVVGDDTNADAAWYYAEPKEAASNIAGHIAFWKGIQVVA